MDLNVNSKIFILIIITFVEDRVSSGQLYSRDPDIYGDVPSLLLSRGFEYESYPVKTEDNYILTIFRIINPYMRRDQLKHKPLLLWHYILSNANIWLINRKGYLNSNGVYSEDNNTVVNDCKGRLTSTLALTLSACGYDVWLANTRGNRYSNKHVNLTTKDPKYWRFSLTEIGLYDVPATIKTVLQITNKKKLSLIGHSMGTTYPFILFTLRPEFQNCVRPFIAFAPGVFLSKTKTILRIFTYIEPLLRFVSIGVGLPLPVSQFIGSYIIGNSVFFKFLIFINGLVVGSDWLNTDPSRFPSFVPPSSDYTSLRVILHYAQFIRTGHFAKFNFNILTNEKLYGQVKPPRYPLNRITSKHIYLLNGLNDLIVVPLDVKRLYNIIPALQGHLITNRWPLWNHIDFVLGRYENKYQDPIILKILSSYN